jgi:manganese-dependent inorganic pyrophosphatase
MSTIIGHSFITQRRRPSTSTAGMLLCAILSDTLNLCGPTTTDYDRQLVSILAELAGVDDIEALAQEQFKAKSQELAACSCEILVNGDQKGFKFNTPTFQGEIGFAVIETIDDDVITARSAELRDELIVCKKKKGLAGLFLAVVNIVLMRSTLILCGETEKSLASAAWDHCTVTGDTMNIGSEVSRKLNFIPRITNAIKDKGWTPPK